MAMTRTTAMELGFEVELTPAIVLTDMSVLSNHIRSFAEPLRRVVKQVMTPSFRANFEQGGRPSPWPPLSPERVAQKERKGARQPSAPLVDSGKLGRVVGQINIWDIQGGYLSDEAYAAVKSLPGAEYGAVHDRGWEFIPKREFLLVQDKDQADIEEVFVDWWAERLARMGYSRA